MPIYEYKCSKCQTIKEEILKVPDDIIVTCNTCGIPMKKLISTSNFLLKGSGWYATERRKEEARKNKGTEVPI